MSGSPGALVRAKAPAPKCGAAARSTGKTCQNPAGFKTDHVGTGRCHLHGGRTPVKSGRYSTVRHERLRTLIEQHAADPDPLNIFPELAAARALFQDFVERYEAMREALLAWHEDWKATRRPIPADLVLAFTRVVDEYENGLREGGDPTPKEQEALDASRAFLKTLQQVEGGGKPQQLLDIADAYRIVSEITKIAERIERVRAANAVSRPELLRILTEMGRAVELHVVDEATKAKIREAWSAIRL